MNLKIGLIGAEGRMGKAVALLHPVFPITRSTPRLHLDCDVLIDFSSPHALRENLSAGKPIVIGTTGHLDFSLIEQAAQYLPVFYAPNFSIGAAILNRIAAFVSEHFPSDIDLIETHHSGKKDSPSGTALHLAKNLPNCRIHSIRSGKTIGNHTLIFNNGEEELTLSHQAQNREAFAKGALAAAHFLIGKPPGLYNMDNLFI
jgi:4-hydroxy-tetrahydrodipicolinate reductase